MTRYAAALLLAVACTACTASRPHPLPAPKPLASPVIGAGRVGGLLPDVLLTGRAQPDHARDLRPGVVMLVGPSCDCLTSVRQVVAATAREGLVLYLVEAGASLDQVLSLATRAGGRVGPYADPGGALARAYGLRTAAALVLVRDDGVVTQVVEAVGPSLRLTEPLRHLVSP